MKKILLLAAFSFLLMGASCAPKNIPAGNLPTNNQSMSEIKRTIVVLKTSMGDVKIELYDDLAPKTVKNFLDLAGQGFYDGILFHRVIPDFMIQGGDPLTKSNPKDWDVHGTGGPGYKFADEIINKKIVRGSLAMANSGPNTNGSQFFIVTAPATPWLDGSYNLFGQVLEGMDVVDAISAVKRNENDHPLQDVEIVKVEILK